MAARLRVPFAAILAVLIALGSVGPVVAAPAAAGSPAGAVSSAVPATPVATVSRVRLGSWTTYFVPGAHNGYGANIWVPARIFDHMIVRPGQSFDFWTRLGPITYARGFRLGGAIVNGHSQEGVALGGGICAVSTTLFNAALRAGLTINARYPHWYHISRYPTGLDATVSGSQGMRFTNDTPYPIEIRGYALKTGRTGVRFDLWGLSDGRRTVLSQPTIRNYQHAVTRYVHTSSLRDGVYCRLEYTVDGFDAWVTRWVYSATGKLIHHQTFYTHYHTMNGVVYVGDHHAPFIRIPSYAPGLN